MRHESGEAAVAAAAAAAAAVAIAIASVVPAAAIRGGAVKPVVALFVAAQQKSRDERKEVDLMGIP